MSTTTNADYYSSQFATLEQQQSELQAAYSASWDKIDNENSSIGMIILLTSTLNIACEELMLQVENCSVTLNALSTMQTDQNSMQSCYNDANNLYNDDYNKLYEENIKNGQDPATASYNANNQATSDMMGNSEFLQDVQNAQAYGSDMQDIANMSVVNPVTGTTSYPFESISEDITNQLNTIFAPYPGTSGTTGIAENWCMGFGSAYQTTNPDSSDDSSTSSSGSSSSILQGITSAFSSISSDIGGLSSSTQSEEQFDVQEYNTMLQENQSLAKSFDQLLMAMVHNEITS
jgi:hypothetical protein